MSEEDKATRIARRLTKRLMLSPAHARHYQEAYHRLTTERGLRPDDLKGLVIVPDDCDLESLHTDLQTVHFDGLLINLQENEV